MKKKKQEEYDYYTREWSEILEDYEKNGRAELNATKGFTFHFFPGSKSLEIYIGQEGLFLTTAPGKKMTVIVYDKSCIGTDQISLKGLVPGRGKTIGDELEEARERWRQLRPVFEETKKIYKGKEFRDTVKSYGISSLNPSIDTFSFPGLVKLYEILPKPVDPVYFGKLIMNILNQAQFTLSHWWKGQENAEVTSLRRLNDLLLLDHGEFDCDWKLDKDVLGHVNLISLDKLLNGSDEYKCVLEIVASNIAEKYELDPETLMKMIKNSREAKYEFFKNELKKKGWV